MPFFNILDSTRLNHTFFAIFIFLFRKIKEDYISVLKILQKVLQTQEIIFSKVIIIDKD
jgi:hypothetical protein